MKKLGVAILGATGSVGQNFINLLSNHPWFEVVALVASDRSVGKTYAEAVNWFLSCPIPSNIANIKISSLNSRVPCKIIFSALDDSVAGEAEKSLADAGHIVISNTKSNRMLDSVPLFIPEVNASHLQLIKDVNRGCIIANPNCAVIGLSIALKPLLDQYGLNAVNVVTMQAVSGAGFSGVTSMQIIDNLVPYISGEEEKLETEPQKILGYYNNGKIDLCKFAVSAHCNRVPVLDGHTMCVSVKLDKCASEKEIVAHWNNYKSDLTKDLPSAPQNLIEYFDRNDYPQPRLHRNCGKGMQVSIGRLRKCSLLDYKFVLLSHNTLRGAAGGAILCAEYLYRYELSLF